MVRILTNIYGILTTVALAIGLVVAVIFFAALIAGQETGTSWALAAGEIMTWGIMLAAIATAAGLIYIYATGAHSLTMETKSKEDSPDNE